jgi:ATPase family protein associated with various cellular activities (AAA)
VTDDGPADDRLRADLGTLVRRLLEETPAPRRPTVGPLVRSHLGLGDDDDEAAERLRIYTEELDAWELPNLQLALDDITSRDGWSAKVLGLGSGARHYADFGLGEFITGSGHFGNHFQLGPAQYVNVPVGPGRTLACLELAVFLVSSPGGPLCLLLNRSDERHGGGPPLSVQTASDDESLTQRFLADLRRSMDEHDVYRGQVIAVQHTVHGRSEIVFLERPKMGSSELILPDGALDRIETHILGPTEHRQQLIRSGRHLARGLLLWGPPGTGKTHTIRYLTGRLTGATIVLLSGSSLGSVGAFSTLARRLAPSVMVLEDVDLVAQEREYGPFGSNPVLFELMNQMDGLGEDADVAFVLTTNRPDALEPALAARPGRVDLAVEIPLPDAAARRRLVELYSRGLDLRDLDAAAVVERTDGVTASFIKELFRKSALAAATAGRDELLWTDVQGALDELLSTTSALTRTLLGVGGADGAALPGPEPGASPAAYSRTVSRGWMHYSGDDV